MLEHCQTVSTLLNWQPPELLEQKPVEQEAIASQPEEEEEENQSLPEKVQQLNPGTEREFFARYYHLLQIEGRAGEQQQAQLWLTPVEERIERGSAILGLEPSANQLSRAMAGHRPLAVQIRLSCAKEMRFSSAMVIQSLARWSVVRLQRSVPKR
ncbi:hypothetical protein [Dictyobacter kobayashii]|uniref:Uncharacterized protein n=1 Tax=Dictyobacter kobayashii TaxID=2014872 RepID=A0A402AKV9_9CHLR|nr:hypothetical protein [Dictyobacter kobayashii]GCE19650.1 hypothetical protein KDK_34500 [Dictyobacter kobayashii]